MNKRLDVVFIVPGGHKKVFQRLAGDFSAIEPPVLVGLIANYLRGKKLRVSIIDTPALGISNEEVVKMVCCDKPWLIVVVVYGHQPSASTQTMPAAREISQLIMREINIPIMMIGTHPSALPERTLLEEDIDFVCQGEGPITIYETARALKEGGDLSEVKGLWHWENRMPIFNQSAPMINSLDEVFSSGVAWDLLPMEKYRAHNWHCFNDIERRQPYASLYTSFGCPYSCAFCCINAPFGKSSYRMFSPDWVIREIDIFVNKYGVRNIKIVDEMFVLNRNHVLGICDRIIDRGYDLNIWAYARVDTIKDEYLEKLREAGFCWLALGIESGSKHVRDGVEKGRFGTTDIINVVRKIQNAGINVIGNYIFGLPDDTRESMQETLDLAVEANCEFANFYCAMAYPGSSLYAIAKEKKWPLPDSWIGFSQHSYECLPLPTETLSAADVLRFRDNAFNAYFKNPVYLEMMERKFGKKAIEHIKKMLSIDLNRKILED